MARKFVLDTPDEGIATRTELLLVGVEIRVVRKPDKSIDDWIVKAEFTDDRIAGAKRFQVEFDKAESKMIIATLFAGNHTTTRADQKLIQFAFDQGYIPAGTFADDPEPV